ncbi:MAG TPA: peptide ABC transporter substrate-binding protein [Anaerolineaceae bacterium]|nr:peptide ABC transporter substrate-binding protein [Anaerolineaceae bacterium]
MKKLRWQLIIILLTGLVVGVLLVTQQQTKSSALPSVPQPSVGGIYTEGLIGSYQRFNPLLDIFNPPDRDVDHLLFSGLIRFDSRGVPQPDLADSWGISKDGTIYNFSIRSGMTWHDGKPLTTDDVLFTIELMRNADQIVPADLQKFWKDVDVKRLSETVLQFRLPEPYAPFLDYLSFGVLPKHLLGNIPADQVVNAPFNMQPVGSGPYRFDHLVVENNQVQGVALTAYDKYFGKKPYISQVIFRYYPDSKTVYQAYQQGQIMGISQITADLLPKAMVEPNLSLYTARQPELALILFNLKNDSVPFLKTADIRRAFLMGLNRQWLIDHILNGQAIQADGPLFPGTWAYFDGIQRVSFDPETAKELIKKAGYTFRAEGDAVRTDKEGKQLAFHLVYPDEPAYKAIAEQIQKNWADLGAKVDLEALPYDQLISERLEQHNYEAALVSLNLSHSPDPDPYPFWDQAQAANGQNYTQWNNRNASEYLERARTTVDQAERLKGYRNFQVIFAQELPALPLFYPVFTYAVDKQVQGVQLGPLIEPSDRLNALNTWFLIAKRNPAEKPTATPTK